MPKPIHLGIIGAENSHSWKLAELCNLKKLVPLRVTHIWGETDELARSAARKGGIPHVAANWKKLATEVDGVLILHRHGRRHAAPARFFLRRGLPVFIDKPITCDLAEARSLFDFTRSHGAPVLSFSSIPQQRSFQKFAARARAEPILAINASGPCDLHSKYGGIFFYGIHLIDGVLELMGCDVRSASLVRAGGTGIATLKFPGGRFATINFLPEGAPYHWRACGAHQTHCLENGRDAEPYLTTAKTLAGFFRHGHVPFSMERMLAPIEILETLASPYGPACAR